MKKHTPHNLRIRAAFAWLFCFIGLTACVYKLDIQQGNILEREKVTQLKQGMSKRQVRFVLGTPLVIDTFNQDRWEYYYSIKSYSPDDREGSFRQERLVLYFENDRLVRIDNQLSADKMLPPVLSDQEKRMNSEATDAAD